MSQPNCDIGVVGLGVMGANLARNLSGHGYRVAGYDRKLESAQQLAADCPGAGLQPVATYRELVASLTLPRRVLIMVPAGLPVGAVIEALGFLLGEDDVVVDGGNSLYEDTDRRYERAESQPWHFVGMGVSGGAEGALRGPSLMPGGERLAYAHLQPLLEAIAATSDAGPCVTWCGHGSAGHFVKMVHNGIEYGVMQLIAETATLLREPLGLQPAAIADVFATWDAGILESFLIEITADIFRVADPANQSALLLDTILDSAGQKGTGRWTVRAALDLAIAVPTISAAVDARVLSASVAQRKLAATAYENVASSERHAFSVDDLRDALYAAELMGYLQGFELLSAGSKQQGYETNLAEVARIWRAGCIIRARLLDKIREALHDGAVPLLLSPVIRDELASRIPALRRVVAAAASAGVPVPALAASLAWFETLRTGRGSAALIQAQRDYFGSHGYERLDDPGRKQRADWSPSRRGRLA